MEDSKVVDFKDGKLVIEKSFSIDPNKDGEALVTGSVKVEVALSELPDEALDAWKKMREDKK